MERHDPGGPVERLPNMKTIVLSFQYGLRFGDLHVVEAAAEARRHRPGVDPVQLQAVALLQLDDTGPA